MVDIPFKSIGSKLTSAAGKIAPILGTAQGFLQPATHWAGGEFNLEAIVGFMKEKAGNFIAKGPPNPLDTTLSVFSTPDVYPAISGATAMIGGWIAGEVGDAIGTRVGTTLKSLGNIATRYGGSAVISSLIAGFLYRAGNPHAGGQGFTTGYQRNTREPAGQGDTGYRTRATAHIRSAAGPIGAGPR